MQRLGLKEILSDLSLTVVIAFMLGFFIWYARQADRAVLRYEQWLNQQILLERPDMASRK